MDYYSTLGISKNATQDEIKKAYRKMAAQYHPDKGGDTAKFQEIQKAYETLSDPSKKHQYDNPQSQGFAGGGFHGFPGGFHFHTEGFDINDLFGHVFRQQNPFSQRQQVFRTQMSVTLEESYNGGSQTLKIQTPTNSKIVNIDIPRGVKDGDQFRYDHLLDGASLIIDFKIKSNLYFERRGNDLYSNQQISVLDLIVGGKFDFKTISGKVFEVDIKPKTQPFMQLKIQGQGMPVVGSSSYGDQIILIKPIIPDIIDASITESILRSKNI